MPPPAPMPPIGGIIGGIALPPPAAATAPPPRGVAVGAAAVGIWFTGTAAVAPALGIVVEPLPRLTPGTRIPPPPPPPPPPPIGRAPMPRPPAAPVGGIIGGISGAPAPGSAGPPAGSCG